MTVRGTARLLADLILLLAAVTMPATAARAASTQAVVTAMTKQALAEHARLLPAPTACRNGLYLTTGTTLTFLDATTGRDVRVATLPHPVNALAYAADHAIFYGISNNRIVTLDAAGHVTDRGPAPSGTSGSYAGAISGDRWYVRSGGALHIVSIDPGSSHYLHVMATVSVNLTGVLGDWDVNPADGRLYGLVTGAAGRVRLVSVNASTGAVTVVATPAGLPNHSSYGGIVISGGTLSALYNPDGTLYSLPLAHPDQVSVDHLGTVSASDHDDAAACPTAWDFGDAPASYGTTLADDGPRHQLTTLGQLTIGAGVDADRNGTPSASAAADSDDGFTDPIKLQIDTNVDTPTPPPPSPSSAGLDDRAEARVAAPPSTNPPSAPATAPVGTASLRVPVVNTTGTAALLAGWLDADADGRFEAAERALSPVPADATTVTLQWTLPHVRGGTSVLRLRLYGTDPANPSPPPSPRGPASGGEVEDHAVTLVLPAPKPTMAPSPKPPKAQPVPRPIPPPPPPTPSISPIPVAKVAAVHAERKPPWQPHRELSLTWTVVVLLLIPTAACAVRAAGHTIRRGR